MNRIKYYREYYGMSQRQLAMYAKISNVEVNYIESGKHTPSVYKAIRIAKVLKVPVEKLFFE